MAEPNRPTEQQLADDRKREAVARVKRVKDGAAKQKAAAEKAKQQMRADLERNAASSSPPATSDEE